MNPPPLLGINGRLRQHITVVGAAYANRISSPSSRKAVTNDDFVKELLESGKLTEKQLQQAIDGYNYFGSTFAWMSDVKDSILDRADNVFLAKYGRDPIEDSDFAVNSNYYRICKNLERNWHYYNADLEKLRWDYKGEASVVADSAPKIIEEVEYVKCPKGSTIGFIFMLGFCVFPVLPVIIGFTVQGIVDGQWKWLLADIPAIGWLWATFSVRPRSISEKRKIRKCGNCGQKFYQWETPSSCSNCGVRFHEK